MKKWKQNFRNVCKCIKKKKLKYHIYISIQSLCNNTCNIAQVPPISLDHCWDVSTPWLESTCCKLNWLDMIWKGTHLSIKGLTADNAYQSENQAMRSKELPADLRDRILSRHRSGGRLQKNSAALKVSKSTLASIILKWKKFGTTRTLPRAGRPAKVSNWWRRALSRLVTKNLMVTLVELHDHICRWEKPTEGQTSLQHSTDLGFMAVWPNSILSSVKTHENTLGICKTAPKGPTDSEKQDYLVWWTSILSIMFEGN